MLGGRCLKMLALSSFTTKDDEEAQRFVRAGRTAEQQEYEESNKTTEVVLFVSGIFVSPIMWFFACCRTARSRTGKTLQRVAVVLTVLQFLLVAVLIILLAAEDNDTCPPNGVFRYTCDEWITKWGQTCAELVQIGYDCSGCTC